jgi:4-alpha-glucanotransferase
MDQRVSGILFHPTSLANACPIGDLGPSANAFVDFLFNSGQRRWQMLPSREGEASNYTRKSVGLDAQQSGV